MGSFCWSCLGRERNRAVLNTVVESTGVLSDFKVILFFFSLGMLYTLATEISDLKCLRSYWVGQKICLGIPVLWKNPNKLSIQPDKSPGWALVGRKRPQWIWGCNIWLRLWCSVSSLSVSLHVKYFICSAWPHSVLMVTPWASHRLSHCMAGNTQGEQWHNCLMTGCRKIRVPILHIVIPIVLGFYFVLFLFF